ncbi:MAG: hypothetical protein AAB879_02815 [Patescibacteria group bacterium]
MQRHNGASLLEVLVAIGVFATVAITSFLLLTSELQFLPSSRSALQAVELAEEGLEASRAIRDLEWSALATGTHGLVFTNSAWGFQATSDTMDGFTRQLTVTERSTNERSVESTVRWTGMLGRAQSFTLTTTLSNWRNLIPRRLFGNWQNPQTLGTIDLGPGNQGRSIAVRDGYVYMAASAENESRSDFFVIDATSGTHPIMRGSINTGPGLVSIALNGAFAYVANDAGTAQLQTINIANVGAPAFINSFRLGSNTEEGTAVAASGTIVYAATEKDAGPEFFVVNVANPTAPTVLGSLKIGETVNDIILRGNFAYLATASSTCEFLIVDLSDAPNPRIRACANLPGTNAALSVYVNDQDNRAYVVRKLSTGTNTPELAIFDISNPPTSILLGTLEFSADIRSVFAADSLAFLGTSLSNQEFQIYDVTTPATPTPYGGLNFPQVANDLAFENNVIYVAVRSNDALRIITSQ